MSESETPNPFTVRVTTSQQRRKEGGEEPIQIGPVWIDSKHVKTEADRDRIRAKGRAAFKRALKPYIRKR